VFHGTTLCVAYRLKLAFMFKLVVSSWTSFAKHSRIQAYPFRGFSDSLIYILRDHFVEIKSLYHFFSGEFGSL
jgi:hypothetical protein